MLPRPLVGRPGMVRARREAPLRRGAGGRGRPPLRVRRGFALPCHSERSEESQKQRFFVAARLRMTEEGEAASGQKRALRSKPARFPRVSAALP